METSHEITENKNNGNATTCIDDNSFKSSPTSVPNPNYSKSFIQNDGTKSSRTKTKITNTLTTTDIQQKSHFVSKQTTQSGDDGNEDILPFAVDASPILSEVWKNGSDESVQKSRSSESSLPSHSEAANIFNGKSTSNMNICQKQNSTVPDLASSFVTDSQSSCGLSFLNNHFDTTNTANIYSTDVTGYCSRSINTNSNHSNTNNQSKHALSLLNSTTDRNTCSIYDSKYLDAAASLLASQSRHNLFGQDSLHGNLPPNVNNLLVQQSRNPSQQLQTLQQKRTDDIPVLGEHHQKLHQPLQQIQQQEIQPSEYEPHDCQIRHQLDQNQHVGISTKPSVLDSSSTLSHGRLPVLPEEDQSVLSHGASSTLSVVESIVLGRMSGTQKNETEADRYAISNNKHSFDLHQSKTRLHDDMNSVAIDVLETSNVISKNPLDGSTTILPAIPSNFTERHFHPLPSHNLTSSFLSSSSTRNRRDLQRELASLAGVSAHRTGNRSFQVVVDLLSVPSRNGNTDKVQGVMDILANPELLRFWCDPVMSGAPHVITNSSEGARTSWNWQNEGLGCTERNSNADKNPNATSDHSPREYEGEWIEITAMAPIVEPIIYGSYCTNVGFNLYRSGQLASAFLGCPVYSKVSMFVERLKGQISLNIGTFAGGIEVCHNVRVIALCDNNITKVRVLDEVQVNRNEESINNGTSATSLLGFGTMRNIVEHFFLPEVDDYMDQVVRSMARLRFLVESYGTAGIELSTTDKISSNYGVSHVYKPLDDDDMILASPLLLHQHHLVV